MCVYVTDKRTSSCMHAAYKLNLLKAFQAVSRKGIRDEREREVEGIQKGAVTDSIPGSIPL